MGVRVADDGSYAVLVEVNIETDFAARDESFAAFVAAFATSRSRSVRATSRALLAGGLDAEREKLVQSIGENVSVRRIALLEAPGGKVASYLHADNRKAHWSQLIGGDDELRRDVAMHVTASKPMVVSGADVAPEIVEKEREIFTAQAQDSGKPAEIIAKMVEGRVRKFLAEISLLEQPFVKDPNVARRPVAVAEERPLYRLRPVRSR